MNYGIDCNGKPNALCCQLIIGYWTNELFFFFLHKRRRRKRELTEKKMREGFSSRDNASKAELSWPDAVIVAECTTPLAHNHCFKLAIAVSR
jgi:hypothetical protein